MAGEIDAWFDSAGARSGELRRVDEFVTAAAPGIDRQLVPMGSSEEESGLLGGTVRVIE